MDRHFRLQDKKILLLIDNAPSHFDPNYHPPVEQDGNDDEPEASEASTSTSRNRARSTRK
jgi:hypothetical protein